MGRKYAIDANIFISASRLYYPFDVAPAFWKQLLEKGADKVILIDRICDEIFRGAEINYHSGLGKIGMNFVCVPRRIPL